MCFERILHNLVSPVMHQKRLSTLCLMVEGALNTKRISVTSLGKGITLPIQERSCIRRSDRFIGNKALIGERVEVYKQTIKLLIGSKPQPKILIDWSQVPNTKHHILRATLAASGRPFTLYEEVHEEKKLNNASVEINFLTTLKLMLPQTCSPIVITDAGFRTPWFKKVLELGWNYIGRVRGTPCYHNGETWVKCKSLLSKAKVGFEYIGKKQLCKTNTINTHLYLIKQKSKGRKSTRRKSGGKRDELNYKRSGKEAWLLASSLPGGSYIKTKRIKKIYEKRMQIEQGFRDLKNQNYGFGMRNAYSRSINRIKVLLMIAMLAMLVAWIIGYYIEKNKMHYAYQCNSLKTRRVLSLVNLGCRGLVRDKSLFNIDLYDILKEALNEIC